MTKNGMEEVWIGSLIRVNGRPMMIDDVQNETVIVRDMRTKNIITYGLKAFKRLIRQIGYEFKEGDE